MLEKLVEVAITALLATVGAWWGGRLGVRRALEQTKAERAFERRLEWYERAITSLGELAAAQMHVGLSARMRFSEEIQSANVDAMLAKQPAVSRVFAEAGMYATPDAVLALAALAESTRVLPSMKAKDPSDLSKGFTLDVEWLERSAEQIGAVITRLTLELRSHVGYEQKRAPRTWRKLLGIPPTGTRT